MAKDKTAGGKKGPRIPKQIAGVKVPKGLRDSGKAAVKFARSPMARELLSAGLVAAAAAVAANSRARKAAQQSGAEASDAFAKAADTAAESASKIGAAFVEAAGAAAQRLFASGKDGAANASAPVDQAKAASKVVDAPPPGDRASRTSATLAKKTRANGATTKNVRTAKPKAKPRPAGSPKA